MLIFMSDLHFGDVTAGNHNLPAKAFTDVFLPNVLSLIRRKKATELKVVLLGDIFDLIRTEYWLRVPANERPWGADGLADVPVPTPGSAVEQHCLSILGVLPADGQRSSVTADSILDRNWDALAFLRKGLAEKVRENVQRADFPVELMYIPGNHDRLCNLYPSVRDAVRDILGLTINNSTAAVTSPQDWWYHYDLLDKEYDVFARHGNQFDTWNYGGALDFTRAGQIQVSIGDVMTTEFAIQNRLGACAGRCVTGSRPKGEGHRQRSPAWQRHRLAPPHGEEQPETGCPPADRPGARQGGGELPRHQVRPEVG